MIKITDEEIKLFSQYIYEISGIDLDQSKGYLIETRLKPLIGQAKCQTFSEFLYKAKSDSSGRLKQIIVDAISTNETFFFRDGTPFDLLRNKVLPELIDRRRQQYQSTPIPLRIWSAACSSGQELYSIAITLKEMLANWRAYKITIIGSDISDKVIAQASYGKYSRFEVERGLPKQYLHRYFNQIGTEWRIKDEIRAMAQFNKINLLKPFSDIGKFDIIFCRNVAIYFSQADRRRLFNNFANVLEPDGVLLIGGSENLSGLELPFESQNYLKGIYYQKKGWEKVAASTPPVKRLTPPRPAPAAPVARTVAAKPKTVSAQTKPVQTIPAISRPKTSVPPPQQSPKAPKPALHSVETGRVNDSPKEMKPDRVSSPSPPTVPAQEKPSGHSSTHEGLTKKQPPEAKKSLLNALQEKKSTNKPQLSKQQADLAGQNNSGEAKESLLDKLARRHKDKNKEE